MAAPQDLRFCHQGGHLVSPDWPVPDDTSEYEDPRDNTQIGCNRLECARCGVPVRQSPGVRVAKDAGVVPADLYDAPDWRSLPGIEADDVGRLYACRCTMWLEMTRHYANPDDPEALSDPSLPWRCVGHPPPELPVDVDGVTIDAGTDLPALVARVLRGFVPPGAQAGLRDAPPLWLGRLYLRLERTSRGAEVSRAIGACVSDRDPNVRGGALFFFNRFPRAPGFDQVVALVQTDPSGAAVRHYPIPGLGRPGSSALYLLARRLTERHKEGAAPDALDERVAKLLEDVLTRPRFPWPEIRPEAGEAPFSADRIMNMRVDAMLGLAALDGAWLVENAPALERVSPGRWEAVIRALAWADRIELIPATAMALLESRLLDRATLAKWLAAIPYRDQAPWVAAVEAILA